VVAGLAVVDFTFFAGDVGGYSIARSPGKKVSILYHKVRCRKCIYFDFNETIHPNYGHAVICTPLHL
jgi:hypothetical protein